MEVGTEVGSRNRRQELEFGKCRNISVNVCKMSVNVPSISVHSCYNAIGAIRDFKEMSNGAIKRMTGAMSVHVCNLSLTCL